MLFKSLSIRHENVELQIRQLLQHGYTGSRCDYSGVVVSNSVDNEYKYYGPFCQQNRHESYSITDLKLPLYYAHIVLYSYIQYSTIFVSISLKTHQMYLGDVLPLVIRDCKMFKRSYGKIIYSNERTGVIYKQSMTESLIIFLPDTVKKLITTGMIMHLRDTMGIVAAKLKSNGFSFCRTDWRHERDDYVIRTNCSWIEPIVIIKRHFPTKLELKTRENHVVPYSDITMMVNYNESSSFFKVSAVKQRQTSFSYITIQNSSCMENVSMVINSQDEFGRLPPHKHRFLVGKEFEWVSINGKLDFEIRLLHRGITCEVTILHQSHEYPFCVRDWYNISSMCYEFWRWPSTYIFPNPLCNEIQCYTMMKGGQLSWNQAQDTCEDIHGSVVFVNSHEEMEFVRMMLHSPMPLANEKLFLHGIHLRSNVGGF